MRKRRYDSNVLGSHHKHRTIRAAEPGPFDAQSYLSSIGIPMTETKLQGGVTLNSIVGPTPVILGPHPPIAGPVEFGDIKRINYTDQGRKKGETQDPTEIATKLAVKGPKAVAVPWFRWNSNFHYEKGLKQVDMGIESIQSIAMIPYMPVFVDSTLNTKDVGPECGYSINALNIMLGSVENTKTIDIDWFISRFRLFGAFITHNRIGPVEDVLMHKSPVCGFTIFGELRMPNLWAAQAGSLGNGCTLYLALCLRDQTKVTLTGNVTRKTYCILPFASFNTHPTKEETADLGEVLYYLTWGSVRIGNTSTSRSREEMFRHLLMEDFQDTHNVRNAAQYLSKLPHIHVIVAERKFWKRYHGEYNDI